ncbi:MAG: hypothetical protein RIA63_03720, partial [Cyclobacteriaceae bacterium]
SLTFPLHAQEEVERQKNARIGFGWTIAMNFLDKEKAENYGISNTGMTWIDCYLRLNLFKYVNLDGGLAVSKFNDELPFSQSVAFVSGPLQGLPSDAKSKIVSGGFYYALGTAVPVIKRINILGKVGKWNYSATRTITNCKDCNKVDLPTTAGTYVEGGLAYASKESKDGSGQVYLIYRHYLEGDFIGMVGVGFTLLF